MAHLDGLRGLAAAVVLVHHAMLSVSPFADPYFGDAEVGRWAWLVYSPLHELWDGTGAVVVFFVLSGIVLTLPVLKQRRYNWVAYYPARLLRLYLPVIAAVLLALALAYATPRQLAGDPSVWMRAHAQTFGPGRAARDALLLGGTSWLNSPLWSLRWEVLFSLALPVFVVIGLGVRRCWFAAVVLSTIIVGAGPRAGHPSIGFLATFLIGVLLAVRLDLVHKIGQRINQTRLSNAIWLTLAVIAVLLMSAHWTVRQALPYAVQQLNGSLEAAAATIAVCAAMEWRVLRRLLCRRGVQWLGTLSFSMYLVHEPVIVAVVQLFPYDLRVPAALVGLLAGLGVAWVFHQIVERPSHRLSQAVRGRVAAGSLRCAHGAAQGDQGDGVSVSRFPESAPPTSAR